MSSTKIRFLTSTIAVAIAAITAAGILVGCDKAKGDKAMASSSKQLWHCGMHPQVIQDHPGDCPICHMALTPLNSNSSTSNGKKKVLYWWDPMLGPSSISDHPGKSDMNMDMIPVYANEAGPQIQIDPAVVQNMGVRTAKVTRGSLTKTVRTVGMLKLPEPGLHDVALKVGGWIDNLYADQDGMHVVKGEPLFDLYSPDMQVAEQELIAATQAEKALRAGASPAIRGEARNLVESARHKLRLWDVADEDIDTIAKAERPPKDVPFRSPASGHLEEKMIVQGSAVQAGMKLMRVADHTKMWLDAQVYQEQLPVVKLGQEVIATVDGIPGKTFKGTISFMYPHVDHMTRTLSVRMTLDNPGFELKPGMYATADIRTQPIPDTILVPREAVIDTGSRQIAFVTEGDGHFTPRIVRMGMMGDDDKVQIIEGLAPGEIVVTSGQFLMDVESRTIEASQKLSAPPMAAAPAMASNPSAEASASSQPAGAVRELSVTNCPMAKADWLQKGNTIANPYMGTKMLDCGSVTKKVPLPPAGSELSAVVDAYLDVANGLDADKVDAAAIKMLQHVTNKLTGDNFATLKTAAQSLVDAKDIKTARLAFKPLSAQLIAALERRAK